MVVNEQCDELLYQKIFEIRCKKFRDFLFDFGTLCYFNSKMCFSFKFTM